MKNPALIVILGMSLLTGCTVYQTAPGSYSTTQPSKFDQSWSAAIGALNDQGVHITTQDRSAGVIQGSLNGIDLTTSISTQADGRIRVEFSTRGATSNDPTLINRITDSYNSRMGR